MEYKLIKQVKTFSNKFNWKTFKILHASEQINDFLKTLTTTEIIEIRPWNDQYVAVTYFKKIDDIQSLEKVK